MKIINPVDYIFFKIFEIGSKIKHSKASENDAAFAATNILSVLLALNLIAVYSCANLDFNFALLKIAFIGFYIVIYYLCYYFYVLKKRYINIKEKISSESKFQKILGSFIVLAYAAFSVYILFH